MHNVCRCILLFLARKAGRYRKFLKASLVVSLFFGLHTTLVRLTKPRLQDPDALPRVFTPGDVTKTGLKAYSRGWVGFPTLSGRVNCSEAIARPRSNFAYPQTVPRISARTILAEAQADCGVFQEKFGFNRHPTVSKEEREFPIAFIILFHKDLDQVLFLLRAIYRPHNVYCLSVDLGADPELIAAVSAVSGCLRNVFVASKLEHIVYAGFSRLLADLHSMEDLLQHHVTWKYVINMPGQQFPLKTNLEMVKILKLYNGANDVLADPGRKALHRRYKFRHHVIIDPDTGAPIVAETVHRKRPPPHGLKVIKGSAYGTLSRDFVVFALRHPWAKDLITWSKDVESPDEYVWATLNHAKNIVVPGGYTGSPDKKPWLSSYTAWQGEAKCASSFVRWICIFSPGDLPRLVSQHHLFANKFYISHHPAALHCLDQYVYNLTVTNTVRPLDYYRRLPFLKPEDNFDDE